MSAEIQPDLPSLHKLPLLTFALFAYNQEEYIRSAIKSALEQTYEPLEIILSDDCSSDKTFEIMQEMAEMYSGPHRVLARQTSRNLRPYSHVLDVAAIAKGSLIILAAGDDISKPNRTSILHRVWQDTKAWALHSRYDVINEYGKLVATRQRSASLLSPNCELRSYFNESDGPVEVVHGATSAYDKRLFEWAPSSDAGILSEDGVFTVVVNAIRRPVSFVDESLVEYRQHDAAISNSKQTTEKPSIKKCKQIIDKEITYSKNILDRAKLIIKFQKNNSGRIRPINTKSVLSDIKLHQAKVDWPSLSLHERAEALRIAITRRRVGFITSSIFGKSLGSAYIFFRMRLRNTGEFTPKK